MFTRKQVRAHLGAMKRIDELNFRQAGRGRNSPGFLRLKGTRIYHTDLLDCGGPYRAIFIWRDGPIREKRAFYAWLLLSQGQGLEAIARIDYHPSHKDVHMVVNCEDRRDLINRALPGCKQLDLKRLRPLDPAIGIDRQALVTCAMGYLGIEFAPPIEGLFS